MDSNEIRKKFLDFFASRGHTVVPSSSLIPDDPSVLLTTAGMQQFKPYFIGKADPMRDFGSKNTVSVQKSFRTSDIDEVGDESHLTFFEMLGNFSFGGYFKKEAIQYGYNFITKEMGLEIEYVSVFEGDSEVPADTESEEIWKALGVKNVKRFGRADNFWGPTGSEGPCGPTTEIYVKSTGGKDIEVWNIVFNEFYCSPRSPEQGEAGNPDKTLRKLEIPGVDTGMGLERLAMVSQKVPTIFDTDLFSSVMAIIPTQNLEIKRVIADHIRGSIHLISDGVEPGNKDREYILRRILRRTIFHITNLAGEEAKIPLNERDSSTGWDERVEKILMALVSEVIKLFPDLLIRKNFIERVVNKEKGRFLDILKSNSELKKIIDKNKKSNIFIISGAQAFGLFSTMGIPIDYICDEGKKENMQVDIKGFEEEYKRHQEISRAGQEKKFGGHGLILNTGELKASNEEEVKKVTRLHTATHLLQASLRKVLGGEVKQAGSDITAERTRFDFTFPRKVTKEELQKIEDMANEVVTRDFDVIMEEMAYTDAVQKGALAFFKEKYPERVSVYSVVGKNKEVFSRELCGGPHVKHTKEIGKITITKEESSAAGVRRIRATIKP
ncbi:MAG: alanine--tRNA ligase-related protein [bacterium]|nr:alanine--tRNA ligase-related protein [bacterium]